MNVEGLACCVIGARQVCVPVIFSDEHPETRNGMPMALVRGCTVARDQTELARQVLRLEQLGPDPVGVRLYVEPDTTDASLPVVGGRVPGPGGPAVRGPLGARLVARRGPPAPPDRDQGRQVSVLVGRGRGAECGTGWRSSRWPGIRRAGLFIGP